jgi:hypothetical protein
VRRLSLPLDSRFWTKSAAPLLFLLVVAGWVARPLAGETPISHDHATHLFQAWHFWTEMLGRWRLRGWSHFWAFGYPAGELNPPGADLWVSGFRAMSLGLWSWPRTYAASLFGLVLFTTWAMYRFGRRFLGPWTAVAAALLWLLDPGSSYQGGWDWWMNWGVWPCTLAMSFVLLTLERLDRSLCGSGVRDVIWAGLGMGASLITHPLALIVCSVAIPLLVLDHGTRPTGLRSGWLYELLAAVGLGLAGSGFYLVPMLARSHLTLDFGLLGPSLSELGRNLVDLRLFDNMWPPILLLGLAGGVLALRERRPGGLLLAPAAGICVLLSSDALINVLHAERLTESVLKLEAYRMLLVAKLFFFPLVAQAVSWIVRRPAKVWPTASRGRERVRWVVCVGILLPLLGPVCRRVYQVQIAKSFQSEKNTRGWSDLEALWAWSGGVRRQSATWYRIAYALPVHDHLSTAAPVFDRTPYYKIGYTPAQLFRNFPMSGEPELLQALSVRYVVSDQPLSGSDFELERVFGRLNLYRFTRYRAEPFTLSGPGQAELIRFEPELIELRLRHTTPESRIKVHVANYDRWEATAAGKSVPISPAPAYGVQDPVLMELPAIDGDLLIRYVRRLPDWLGLGLSLLAPLGCLLLLWADRAQSSGWTQRLRVPAYRYRRALGIALLLLAVALFGIGVWRLLRPSPLLPPESLFRHVPPGTLSLAGLACQPSGPLVWQCGPHRVGAAVVKGSFGLHLCMTAQHDGELGLMVSTSLERFLEARYDAARAGPGRIRVLVDGETLGEVSTRPPTQDLQFLQFDTRRYANGSIHQVKLELSGSALHCFDVRKLP